MKKTHITALIGVSGLLALSALIGCGPKAEDTETTTTAPSAGTMTTSPGAMGTPAAPGTMATTAPPPGPK